jgi:hypothetical protein
MGGVGARQDVGAGDMLSPVIVIDHDRDLRMLLGTF